MENKNFFHGRSEFVMVGLLLGVAAILIIGGLNMDVLSQSQPGPEFTPMLIGAGLALVAALLAYDVVRRPEKDEAAQRGGKGEFYDMSIDMLHDLAGMKDSEDSLLHEEILRKETWKKKFEPRDDSQTKPLIRSDWATLGAVIATTIVFVLILPYAGWVLSAAALFWAVSYFLGSSRPLFDVWVGLIVAAITQLIFGGLMGLNLPSGIFGGF